MLLWYYILYQLFLLAHNLALAGVESGVDGVEKYKHSQLYVLQLFSLKPSQQSRIPLQTDNNEMQSPSSQHWKEFSRHSLDDGNETFNKRVTVFKPFLGVTLRLPYVKLLLLLN